MRLLPVPSGCPAMTLLLNYRLAISLVANDNKKSPTMAVTFVYPKFPGRDRAHPLATAVAAGPASDVMRLAARLHTSSDEELFEILRQYSMPPALSPRLRHITRWDVI